MKKSPKENKVTFQKELDRALLELSKIPIESEEYTKAIKNIDALCTARAQKAHDVPSVDTLIMVGANILGILVVLHYEQAHIVTSKAMSFILKGRS